MLSICPKCGGTTSTIQVDRVASKQCDRCGTLPFAVDQRTRKPVKVDRLCKPEEAA